MCVLRASPFPSGLQGVGRTRCCGKAVGGATVGSNPSLSHRVPRRGEGGRTPAAAASWHCVVQVLRHIFRSLSTWGEPTEGEQGEGMRAKQHSQRLRSCQPLLLPVWCCSRRPHGGVPGFVSADRRLALIASGAKALQGVRRRLADAREGGREREKVRGVLPCSCGALAAAAVGALRCCCAGALLRAVCSRRTLPPACGG